MAPIKHHGRFSGCEKEAIMNPKVSICIPTFNRKDYLKETLDSVFAQTYKDYEIIIVDDGSTDGTEEMIKSAGNKVRYFWQENAGDAAARNRLIKLAQGQFITFIDSDDLLMPDSVERMIKVMEAEGGEIIVYGPYLRIDQDGNVFGKCKRKLYSGHITKYLFQSILIHSCGSMFPKRILEEAGGFDQSLRVCSDYDLWLRLSLKYRFIALDKPTFKRRRHTGNLSAGSSKNQIVELKVLEDFYYNKGGDKVIPHRIAMQRLSREEYRIARSALRERKPDLAADYFRASFNRRPNIQTFLMWIIALLKLPAEGKSQS
jgi:glycosyltransferase involved in cell wall biosynthesis